MATLLRRFFFVTLPPLRLQLSLCAQTRPSHKMAVEVATMQQTTVVEDTEKKPLSPPPKGANPDMKEDLAKVWRDLEVKVQKLAEMSSHGQGYDAKLEKDDVMGNLEKMQQKSKKKADSRWAKVKNSFSQTLTAVGRVGGMVADAASQVFAPAGQCYNALNFVISAYQGYLEAFETLQQLFDESFEFLKRLPHYTKGKMPDNLCQIASKFLRTFVEICEKALTLRNSRMAKVAMFIKIAFISTGDFTDYKAQLDWYTHLEDLTVGAVNFERIANTEEGVNKIKDHFIETKAERKEKEQSRLDSEALVKALAFDRGDETWDSNAQVPIEAWTRINSKIHYRKVEGTGEWLFNGDKFKTWENPKGDDPILALVGDQASGKSYLISAAISHLRTNGASKQGTSRRLVAFHYIDNGKPNAEYHSLGKSIIWQFADNDASYKQSIAATCRKTILDPKEILPRLLLNNHKDMENIDAVFYIVINKLGDRHHNVDNALVKFLQDVSQSESKTVRVLFSTTEGTMKNLKRQNISCTTIPISENNESDRRKYIASRMDKMDVLKNSRIRKVAEIRALIQDKLCEKIKGDYSLLNATLEKLRPLESEEEILENLSGASRSMSQHIRDDIDRLNDIRTLKELGEINEIIMWLTFGKGRKSPELITAVLQVKNKAASLLPLEDRLKDKFILFEINEDGYVDFTAEDIPSKIRERRDLAKNRQENSRTVNKNEVDIVNHFLKTVCPSDLLDKLELDKHFEQKLDSRQEQICREDEPTAHFLIAQRCVDTLANHSDARLSALRKYAVENMVVHMSKTERNLINPDSLAQFGSDLNKLFRVPDAIDNLLWGTTPSEILPNLLLPDMLLDWSIQDEIFEWLEDPTVVSKVNAEGSEQWWKVDGDRASRSKALIGPSIRRLAVHCFQRESGADVTIRAFNTIRNWCDDFQLCPNAVAESRAASFSDIEKWCQDQLRAEKNTLWHTQMAIVLRVMDQNSKAEERCNEALKLDNNNWRASLLRAKLIESPKTAIHELEKLNKRFEEDKELQKDNAKVVADIAYNLGHRYWDEKKPAKAIKSYKESIRQDPSASEHVFHIMSKLSKDERWSEIMVLFGQLWNHGKTYGPATAVAMYWKPHFHTILLQAMIKTKALGLENIETVYEDAILTTKDRDYEASFWLRHYYARALLALRPVVPIEKVRDVLEDAVKDLPHTELNLPRAFFRVGYKLGSIYLGKAQEAKATDQPDAVKRWLNKLVEIVPEQLNEDQMRLPLSLFAARYHVTNDDKESARASAHRTLRMAVELLSDDEPGNDLLAYEKILYAAIPFGDDRNATAALAMMEREGGFERSCSCGCGYEWLTPGNMFWCMDCINVVLRPDCHKKVKDPASVTRVCDEKHKHLEIPKWDAEKMNVPAGQVPYKGEAITMADWSSKISEKYHLGMSRRLHALRH